MFDVGRCSFSSLLLFVVVVVFVGRRCLLLDVSYRALWLLVVNGHRLQWSLLVVVVNIVS